MANAIFIEKNAYRNGLTLLLAARDSKRVPGVQDAFCATGSDFAKQYAHDRGFKHTAIKELGESDVFGYVICDNGETAENAIAALRLAALYEPDLWERYSPPTIEGALRINRNIDLAVVSDQGNRAFEIVRDCLLRGLHVMAMTGRFSLQQEAELKAYAERQGLLLMGPDCRTALLHGLPLGYANIVRPGNIGAISATGTGLQKFCCHVDWLGAGISNALGGGRRDLDEEVGGIATKACFAALAGDPATKVIALLLKTFGREVPLAVMDLAAEIDKPIVVFAPALTKDEIESRGLIYAGSIEECALLAAGYAGGEPIAEDKLTENSAEEVTARERGGKHAAANYIRGWFLSGDNCSEVARALLPAVGSIWSNSPVRPLDKLADANETKEHCFIDYGDDCFTMGGRLIGLDEPAPRNERLIREAADPALAVAVVDCILGYGCYKESAAELAEAIETAKARAAQQGNALTVIAILCGTEGDPVPRSKAKATLERAGAIVTASAAEAANLAARCAGIEPALAGAQNQQGENADGQQ